MTADTLSMLKYEVTGNSLLKYLVTNVADGQKYITRIQQIIKIVDNIKH